MHFKEELYAQYFKSHILPRKGPLSIEQLNKKLKVFDLHFGSFLPKNCNAKIIDAGCGNGSLVYWLHKKGYVHACGVDGSADQIAEGKGLGINNLESIDLVGHLSEQVETFDVIFLRDVVEHFRKEEVLPLLKLCHSALKPGGKLVIQVPNGASPFVGRVLFGDFTHETAYTESSLSQLFYVAGYEDFCASPFLPHVPKITWRSMFSRPGRSAIARKLAWDVVSRLYDFMLFSEIGRHTTVTTFNLIATASRPR
ncbi:MAG: class I SAM-dependent methyltransferase [Nitrospirales bacterium]